MLFSWCFNLCLCFLKPVSCTLSFGLPCTLASNTLFHTQDICRFPSVCKFSKSIFWRHTGRGSVTVIHNRTFGRRLQMPDSLSALRKKYNANVLACLHMLSCTSLPVVLHCPLGQGWAHCPLHSVLLTVEMSASRARENSTHNVTISACCPSPAFPASFLLWTHLLS